VCLAAHDLDFRRWTAVALPGYSRNCRTFAASPAEPGDLPWLLAPLMPFIFLDEHRPHRKVKVTDGRIAADFAACRQKLVDVHSQKRSASAPCWF
jgi:hypothetical protein